MVVDTSPQPDLVFHALAHPARRAMVRQLSLGERSLTELAAPLSMTFPAASKHGLVKVAKGDRVVVEVSGSDSARARILRKQ